MKTESLCPIPKVHLSAIQPAILRHQGSQQSHS